MTCYFKIFRPVALAITAFIVLTACDPTSKYEKEERALIQDYLSSHPEYPFELKASGLYYLDLIVGTGRQPVTHDTASIFYTGTYLNGTVIGTNIGSEALVFPVNEDTLLEGFEEGVTYMKEGGKCLILMNSDLGYGNSGIWFPAFTPVLFEISLVSVVPGPGK
jgi:FKBP-type peptidyl-prolyl cis-trans isomerase FkpA